MLTERERAQRRLCIAVRRNLLAAAEAIKKYVDDQLNPSEVMDIALQSDDEKDDTTLEDSTCTQM